MAVVALLAVPVVLVEVAADGGSGGGCGALESYPPQTTMKPWHGRATVL